MDKKRIFIIEDEPIFAEDLKCRLEKMNYQVIGVSHNGEDALKKLSTTQSDLVITDIQLPGSMDGIEVSETIRVRYNTPVIFLTAYSSQEIIDRVKVTKPAGFILKPFRDEELNSIIQIALYQHNNALQIHSTETRYRSFIENAFEIFIILDDDGVFLFISDSINRVMGYIPEELIGTNIIEIINEKDRQNFQDYFSDVKAAVQGFQSVELNLTHRDRTELILEITGTNLLSDPAVRGIILNARDITPRRLAEIRTERKGVQQEKLLQTAQNVAAKLELDEVLKQITHEANELLESQSSTLYLLEDENTLKPVVADDPEFENEILAQTIDVNESYTGQAVMLKKCMFFNEPDSDVKGVKIAGTPEELDECIIVAPLVMDDVCIGALCVSRIGCFFTDYDKTLVGMFANFASIALKNAQSFDNLQQEIRRHKKTTNELTSLKENLEKMVDQRTAELQMERDLFIDGPVATVSWRKQTQDKSEVLYVSRNIQNFGLNPDDILSGEVDYRHAIFPEDQERIHEQCRKYSQEERSYWELEYRVKAADQSTQWIYEFVRRHHSKGQSIPEYYHCYLLNITDVRRAQAELHDKQAQLAHSGRLALLGEMATGVAHELNQPLAIIRAESELLKISLRKTEGFDDIQSELDTIINQVDRAADIIDHVRHFARVDSDQVLRPTNIIEPIEESLVFFSKQFANHNIKLTTHFEEELPLVLVHSQRFEQIVVNFLSNARHAVDCMDSDASEETEKIVDIHIFSNQSSNAVVMEISDNGIGMTPEERAKCQEPFYTTKKKGEGTGLGLAIVKNIVNEFDGEFQIESKKFKGSIMRVTIPASPA